MSASQHDVEEARRHGRVGLWIVTLSIVIGTYLAIAMTTDRKWSCAMNHTIAHADCATHVRILSIAMASSILVVWIAIVMH